MARRCGDGHPADPLPAAVPRPVAGLPRARLDGSNAGATGWSGASDHGRSAAGGRRYRAGVARGAGDAGCAGGPGDAGSRSRWASGGGAAALRRRRRRQCRGTSGRYATGGLPSPAGSRGRRGSGAGASAGAAEASAGRGRLTPASCRAAARKLETLCLRGPRLSPGLGNLRRAVDKGRAASSASSAFLSRIEACLEPALRIRFGDGNRRRRRRWPR